jgi:hypothetical protein
MDKLFELVSEHLSKNARLEVYSSLNQHLIDNEHVVLWDKTAASISIEVHKKFKDVLSKKACSWYTLNKKLPYHDFCIALLCSVGYSLNHNTMPQVQPRTFKSAWRQISIMIGTGDQDIQNWIRDRIQDRDATKYLTALGMDIAESPTLERTISFGRQPTRFTLDEELISKACSSRNIREITSTSPVSMSGIVNKVTATPEGQLDNLRIIHSELIKR